MLLVVDVGNTNTVLGIFSNPGADGGELRAELRGELRAQWRVETSKGRTSDEYAVLLHGLLALEGLAFNVISAVIVATVVPTVLFPVEGFCTRYLGRAPLVVGPGMKTGMPILTENPREVGADRIVNSIAAYERHKCGCIVVDFGTATTFDAVSPRGEYLGGAIAPGISISADALYRAAAKLPRVEITRPPKVVGRNTITSMQSGLVYGYVGLTDAIVERMRAELEFPVKVLATGGLAALIAKESRTIQEIDDMLTLRGLQILHERNARET